MKFDFDPCSVMINDREYIFANYDLLDKFMKTLHDDKEFVDYTYYDVDVYTDINEALEEISKGGDEDDISFN